MEVGLILLIVGGVLAASIVVAFGATRAGVPSLVAFLGLGMLLGSEGLGGIDFDNADLARKVGVVGLAAILFEGGLATSWRRLREIAVPATFPHLSETPGRIDRLGPVLGDFNDRLAALLADEAEVRKRT